MKLKTLFVLGDIGFLNHNLKTTVNLIGNKIGQNDIITLLGDNFYPNGVSSLDDPQWDKYNEIFKDIKNPVYSILGNHDYISNPKAQIFTKNWKMDGWYFKKEFDNVNLYFLDTNQFNLDWVKEDELQRVHNLDSETLIKNQVKWLENELEKDLDKKKIIFGHYPIITNGWYVDRMDKLYNSLIETFKKYKINLYISGHEHNIQYIKKNIDNLDFNQVIIGSSSEARSDSENCLDKDMLDNTDIFYGKLNIDEDKIIIQYFNINDELKYQYEVKLN